MAKIPNFPQRLMDEHARWHMSHMNRDVRSGDGISFLRFHRRFLRKALRWYKGQGLDHQRVTAWSRIPLAVKATPGWDSQLQEAEDRMVKRLGSFKSSDELGRFLLTSSLHDSIHVLGSEVYGDPDFGVILRSPRSTLFYRWHGLIDRWWRKYQQLNKSKETKTKTKTVKSAR
ncbi:hypothetical protein [Paenibacillus harenae]|uniref:hypothetical protein n=1 Tax=Paenibacillus harenae TaxID=306543 RepID=UPI00278D79A1|nr:hypothetical protein [Paenibacillus harenae]MDQ0057890.1 hypothetical protein [Paenibacillus harenae]